MRENTGILLMRFWRFTLEMKWKFLHFRSAEFLLGFIFWTIDYFPKKFIYLGKKYYKYC